MITHKIITKETLHKGWSELTKYILEINSVKLGLHQVMREVYDSGDGAAALLINSESRKVILTRQYRLPAHLNGHEDGYLLEASAGLLDTKDPEQAIKKEILEETGVVPYRIENIGLSYASPGAHMEKIHLYLAYYSEKDKIGIGGGLQEEHEEIEVLEFTFEEIKELYLTGRIQDSKTLILIQYALINKAI